MSISARHRCGFTLIELMIVIAIIAILAAILVPNFIRARAQSQATACKSNLKNIGTALNMYCTDNNGRYPELNRGALFAYLTPNYMQIRPTCPSTGSSAGYVLGYASISVPDAYTLACQGSNHTAAGYSDNFPQFTSVSGLVER